MSRPIRVVVADDSATVRGVIRDALQACDDVMVVGEASNGREAVQLCEARRPDVMTLDLRMPRMDGVAVTKAIMAHTPTPLLIVSSPSERGAELSTGDALLAGAVDVFDKQTGLGGLAHWRRELVARVRLLAGVAVVRRGRAPSERGPPRAHPIALSSRPLALVAIGASTGGPQTLARVLSGLPSRPRVPLVVVLHLAAGFTDSMVAWFDRELPCPVRCLRRPLSLDEAAGKVWFAPGDRHVVLSHGRLHPWDGPELHSCRPSVDVLFHSLAQQLGDRCLAALLTGMGRDGADGLAAIRAAGGRTVAQDEASSVVYGMPAAAIQAGAAQRVLGLGGLSHLFSKVAAEEVP